MTAFLRFVISRSPVRLRRVAPIFSVTYVPVRQESFALATAFVLVLSVFACEEDGVLKVIDSIGKAKAKSTKKRFVYKQITVIGEFKVLVAFDLFPFFATLFVLNRSVVGLNRFAVGRRVGSCH